LIGCRAVTDAERARIDYWQAAPMFGLGDSNGNGVIDPNDLQLLVWASRASTTVTAPCLRAGDVDFDDRITSNDIRTVSPGWP
jgi:hypothetical protein